MIKSAIHLLKKDGVGKKIGFVTFSDSPNGLLVTPDIFGLPAGQRGFHIHEFPNLLPKDGKPGGSAGQHFDPQKTGLHLGPYADGHLGDLPVLEVNSDGTATKSVTAPRLKLEDIKDKAIIIHSGGDNYSDTPTVNGGGKSRIAGGIITNDCPYCRKNNLKLLGTVAGFFGLIYYLRNSQ
jgi:Cu-Zn family superoxide dismutase